MIASAPSRTPRGFAGSSRAWWAAALVLLAGLAAGAPAWIVRIRLPTSRPTSQLIHRLEARGANPRPTGGAAHAPAAVQHLPSFLDGLVVIALGLLLAVVCWPLLAIVRRRLGLVSAGRDDEPASPPHPGEDAGALAARVDAILRDVALEASPRSTVIRSWIDLEAALVDLEATRHPTETSGALAARVLDAFPVDPGAIRELEQLYALARFGPGAVSPAMSARAVAALGRVRDALRARAAVTTGAARPAATP